jgi:branched-chain amino acid transport system substrate-binding protein
MWEETMKDNRIHHPSIRQFRTGVAVAIALAALGTGSALADDIVIGASLPLSGPLASFGSFQQWGYKRAVDEVNKAGGITVDGQ